jgi:hypothetical protein
MGGWANLAAAVELYDRVIDIETAALGANHRETATTLYAKANALVQMGGPADRTAAVELYDRIIEKLHADRQQANVVTLVDADRFAA